MTTLHHPEVTAQALALLRNGQPFQWHLITLLALAVYAYANEVKNRNWRPIAAGLSLYMVHWLFEIGNGLVQHFTGHALWTVPAGTAFLLLIGVGAELSLMFAVAGLVLSKLLPVDPRLRILGIPNRLFFAIANAAGFSIFEIFLARTPAFAWVYPWWGPGPVFITVYVPFFVVAFLCHDWPPRTQVKVIGGLALVDATLLAVFAGLLGWI